MLKYLQEHIKEELEGAEDYMSKAIEYRDTCNGTKFYNMAMMELEHANCLTKMFSSMEKPEKVSYEEYSKMHQEILNSYSTSMGKLEAMKKLYWN